MGPGTLVIKGKVPLSELNNYQARLKSVTAGQARTTMELLRTTTRCRPTCRRTSWPAHAKTAQAEGGISPARVVTSQRPSGDVKLLQLFRCQTRSAVMGLSSLRLGSGLVLAPLATASHWRSGMDDLVLRGMAKWPNVPAAARTR